MKRNAIPFLLLLATSLGAFAADNPAPIDGNWKWTYKTRDGKDAEATVRLKQEGEKITGAYLARDGKETPIENGQIKDDTFTFDVTRDVGGNKMLFKYSGKVA